jgi:hypothetical protein
MPRDNVVQLPLQHAAPRTSEQERLRIILIYGVILGRDLAQHPFLVHELGLSPDDRYNLEPFQVPEEDARYELRTNIRRLRKQGVLDPAP